MITYKVWTEQPTVDFYRRDFCPREDYTLTGMWVGGHFTGASGKRYHGLRGFDELARDNTQAYYFVELNKDNLVEFSPDLYPDLLPFGQLEMYEYSETPDAVHFVGENLRVDIRGGSVDWSDAKGRFQLHLEMLGQAVTFFVNEQEGIQLPLLYRSEIGKATGTINGDPVKGLSLLDSSYSIPSEHMYFSLPLLRKLEKQWSMWLVEYKDSEIDGGLAWKGRVDTGFSVAHLLQNGSSTAFSESRTFTTYHEKGAVWKSRIELGGEVVEIEQDTCADWPFHTFGRVVSTSRGKEIAKSWTFTEWVPDNVEEMAALYVARPDLLTNSREIFPKTRVENECLVIPEGIL